MNSQPSCGISACMIIHDPKTRSSSIWPSDSDQEVRRLIDGYNSRKGDLCSIKHYRVSDFFKDRVKEIEGEVAKLKAKNLEAKYPAWDERLRSMNESQLRGLADALRVKAMNARSRIEFLKEELQMVVVPPPPPYDSGLGQFYNLGQDAGFDPMMMMQNNFGAQIPMGMQDYYASPPLQQQQHYAACYPLLIDESRLDYLYSLMEQNLDHRR